MLLAKAKSVRPMRIVVAAGLLLMIAAILRPAFTGFATASPWILSLNRLQQAHSIVEKFHAAQNQWPKSYSSLVDFANNSEGSFPLCVHPADETECDWIFLPPTNTNDEESRIMLAAPLAGGFMPEDANKRLVQFENGRADWIPEDNFQEILKISRQH